MSDKAMEALEQLRVGNSVYLDDGLSGDGAIQLAGADITGQLRPGGARLTGTDSSGVTLAADGIRVGRDVILDRQFTAAGTVSLRSARIGGSLVLAPRELASGKDAEGLGKVALDATGAQIAQRLRWAPDMQVSGRVILEDAAVGQLEDDWMPAGERANGYEDHQVRLPDLARRSGNHRPVRGLPGDLLVCSTSQRDHSGADRRGLHPAPTATRCTSNYPCFNPSGYAVDTIIPLINVHQADFWSPNQSVPMGAAFAVVTYLCTGLGWILATLAVAGYTGLARKPDAP